MCKMIERQGGPAPCREGSTYDCEVPENLCFYEKHTLEEMIPAALSGIVNILKQPIVF